MITGGYFRYYFSTPVRYKALRYQAARLFVAANQARSCKPYNYEGENILVHLLYQS